MVPNRGNIRDSDTGPVSTGNMQVPIESQLFVKAWDISRLLKIRDGHEQPISGFFDGSDQWIFRSEWLEQVGSCFGDTDKKAGNKHSRRSVLFLSAIWAQTGSAFESAQRCPSLEISRSKRCNWSMKRFSWLDNGGRASVSSYKTSSKCFRIWLES